MKKFQNSEGDSYWKIDIFDIYNFIVIIAVVAIVTFIGTYAIFGSRLDCLFNYYVNTEDFLDSLDQKYDWVDAFDPDAYYSARQDVINTFDLNNGNN